MNKKIRAFVLKALDDGNGVTEDAKEELRELLHDSQNEDIWGIIEISQGRMYIPENWYDMV